MKINESENMARETNQNEAQRQKILKINKQDQQVMGEL